MKFIVFIFMFYFSFSSYLVSDEIIDCNQFDKLSAKYVECKAKNLKVTLNENQKKIKSNVEKKIKKSKFKETLAKFKNSKTGSDFLKKNDNRRKYKKIKYYFTKNCRSGWILCGN